MIRPTLKLPDDRVEVVIIEANPNKNLEMIKSTFY